MAKDMVFFGEYSIGAWENTCILPFLGEMLFLFLFFFLSFLWPHPQHMEVHRLGVKSELQLPAYATATAIRALSCICNLYHSSRKHQILNPLGKVTSSWVLVGFVNHWAMKGTPDFLFLVTIYPIIKYWHYFDELCG